MLHQCTLIDVYHKSDSLRFGILAQSRYIKVFIRRNSSGIRTHFHFRPVPACIHVHIPDATLCREVNGRFHPILFQVARTEYFPRFNPRSISQFASRIQIQDNIIVVNQIDRTFASHDNTPRSAVRRNNIDAAIQACLQSGRFLCRQTEFTTGIIHHLRFQQGN